MRDDTNSPHVCVCVRLRFILSVFVFRTVNIYIQNVAHRCMPNRLMILMKLFGQRFIYHFVKSKLSTENKSCTRQLGIGHWTLASNTGMRWFWVRSQIVKVLLMHLVVPRSFCIFCSRCKWFAWHVCSGSTRSTRSSSSSAACSGLIRNKIKYT